MWEQILPGLRITIFFTVVLGIVYPLTMTGISQVVFPHEANGSLIQNGNKVIGSAIIGQSFIRPEYFHPRPSTAGNGYDATASGGSNLGPTSRKLLYGATKMDDTTKTEVVDFDGISLRIVHFCLDNDIPYDSSAPLEQFRDANGRIDDVKLIKAFNSGKTPLVFKPRRPIPSDAVTGSASGFDPHISPDSAQMQMGRVAKARGITRGQVNELVARFTEAPQMGVLGEQRVNVLKLNLAMDRQFPRH